MSPANPEGELTAPAGHRGRPEPVPPFQAFLDRHREAVYRFLLVSVGPHEADDCFQETFLAALRAYPRLRHGGNLRSWVLTIATRKAIDAARARARQPSPTGDAETLADDVASGEDVGRLDALDPVWARVRALPPRQRVAVVQRHVLDRSYAEIAATLGSSEEAVRANVYQGLRKLREGMEPR